jgi:1,4-alpha-glucan branching enzyme
MTEPTSSPKAIEVTFRLPAAAGATRVSVAGDFNGWSRTDHKMADVDDGLEITIALEPGRWYRYRYWVDDNRWENDWVADWYTPNAYGGDDAVVDLTDESPRVAAAAAATVRQSDSVADVTPPGF